LESGLPIWRYEVGSLMLEKQLLLPHLQNTVHVIYRLVSGKDAVRLELRPSLYIRPHEGLVSKPLHGPYALTIIGDRYEISASPDLPPLRLLLYGKQGALTVD